MGNHKRLLAVYNPLTLFVESKRLLMLRPWDQSLLTLSRAEKSLVAIARGLSSHDDLLVLGEPTASLPESEVRRLHRELLGLREQGVAMINVSHRLDGVFALSDRIVAQRDGRRVAEQATSETTPAELIRHIVGREPDSVFVRPPSPG